jgi:hypothetical protein
MIRSFDHDVMRDASIDFNGPAFDYEGWLANHYNIMYVSGEDVGLLTYDYPGVYTGHWFFKSRGKDALNTAFAMLDKLFRDRDAKLVRGITPVGLKGARYLAKRLGFQSLGIEEYPDGPYEIMVLAKIDFDLKQKERNNG